MSNLAKSWQEGTYVVSVFKNMVRASYPNSKATKLSEAFIEAEVKCDPEDEFGLSMGVALAMDRLNKKLGKNEIKVGDKVKIKNSGKSYTTYVNWIKKNIDDVGLVVCFVYGRTPNNDETVYVVKAIAPWDIEHKGDKMLAYVQKYYVYENDEVSDSEPCYLIGVDGLEKV